MKKGVPTMQVSDTTIFSRKKGGGGDTVGTPVGTPFSNIYYILTIPVPTSPPL